MPAASLLLREWVSNSPRLSVLLDRFKPLTNPAEPASSKEFLADIMQAFDDPDSFQPNRLRKYPIPMILDYLYRTHRYYLEQRLPEIEQSAERLVEHCEGKYPILSLLISFLTHYRQHLAAHIREEEATVFPYVTYLFFRKEYGEAFAQIHAPSTGKGSLIVDQPDHDHALAQGLLQWREVIAKEYPELPELWPCQVLFHQLDAFSDDLHLHERLEEEVLMPLARGLE